ncbi:21947_t:CDS:2, partial [Gigaspora rosea]
YEDPDVNQDVPNSSIAASADQGPSNPNLLDLTSDNEIGEAANYVPLKIVRTINECNTRIEVCTGLKGAGAGVEYTFWGLKQATDAVLNTMEAMGYYVKEAGRYLIPGTKP